MSTGKVRFDNRVVIITGAGNGIGKAYALYFASLGAKVVVNDLGVDTSGKENRTPVADIVVQEIKSKGGQAAANYDSVEFADKIIKTALDNFGRVDVIINNAGILRDRSFLKMSQEDWDLVWKVHVTGSMRMCRAAWKIMRDQGYGRIINTSSASGLYGSFGQANYAAAKMATVGLTKTLSIEGASKNIRVNAIAPIAGTRMTEGLVPKEIQEAISPEHLCPFVAYLASDLCQETGQVYEVGGGWASQVRWQRTEGVFLKQPYTIEDVRDNWKRMSEWTSKADAPNEFADSLSQINHLVELNKPNVALLRNKTSGDKLKSDTIFELMRAFVDRGEAKTIIPKVDATFNFEIVTAKGQAPVKTWTIDLKNGQGKILESKSEGVDATFNMTDEDFEAVCLGKLNPQTAFIGGKMRIRGNMKKASLFTPQLFPPPTPENIQKYLTPKL